jgi:hypothetical protein
MKQFNIGKEFLVLITRESDRSLLLKAVLEMVNLISSYIFFSYNSFYSILTIAEESRWKNLFLLLGRTKIRKSRWKNKI